MCRTLNSDINTNIQTLINRGTVKRVNRIEAVTVTKPSNLLEVIVPDTACNSAKAFITDLKIHAGDPNPSYGSNVATNIFTSWLDDSGIHLYAKDSNGFTFDYTVTCQIIEFY